ncbi:peptide chain release factor N(5)-glutamine methyltransferase [Rhizobium sp. S-51]|uniref:Release factor glutamine methyltransferase n=1 Tax=Rhizobium terricola TaxID=2728849 RepID=A0A7Y0AYP6_9HYPH|nr:peptide chain release factor N(5)-glutamine methyltransferase [Rhizobium terricola]NML75948.1 peptide chain release factor N(5)-glutamine methyltransferase [Rhizobium terricola]
MSGAEATIASLLAEARRRFATVEGLDDPATEARMLIGGLLGLNQTDFVLRGAEPVTRADAARIEAAIRRREAREPVHRILGHREFYGLDLTLSPDTLEPRPDTEILVDTVLPWVRRIVQQKGSARILDLGTGTGAIALALIKECREARAVGVDISPGALTIATSNAYLNGVTERFGTCESAWFDKVEGSFDIIVSNPPYIPTLVVETLDPEVRDHDPRAALDGGEDGLEAYRAIAADAAQHLLEGGAVAVEIGYDQKLSVSQVFEEKEFSLSEARQDYGGNDRVLLFVKKG